MATQAAENNAPRSGLAWPLAPGVVPFMYLGIAWSWWTEIRTQVGAVMDDGPALNPDAMAAASLATRALATLSESAGYAIWWRSRGLRLPYWRFTFCVAAFSILDLIGFTLRRLAADAAEAVRILCEAFAGPAASDPSAVAGTGVIAAFGNLGVLTLLRIGMTAWVQSRGIGRGVGSPLLLTTAAWLVTRLVTWWTFDLVTGLSPVR